MIAALFFEELQAENSTLKQSLEESKEIEEILNKAIMGGMWHATVAISTVVSKILIA